MSERGKHVVELRLSKSEADDLRHLLWHAGVGPSRADWRKWSPWAKLHARILQAIRDAKP